MLISCIGVSGQDLLLLSESKTIGPLPLSISKLYPYSVHQKVDQWIPFQVVGDPEDYAR
jgi:hypothetical protein